MLNWEFSRVQTQVQLILPQLRNCIWYVSYNYKLGKKDQHGLTVFSNHTSQLNKQSEFGFISSLYGRWAYGLLKTVK